MQVENSWTKGALQQLNRDALEAKCDELERAEGSFEEGITQLIDVDGEVEKQAKDLEKSLNNSIAKQYREELEVLATAMANPTIMRVGAPTHYLEQHHPD